MIFVDSNRMTASYVIFNDPCLQDTPEPTSIGEGFSGLLPGDHKQIFIPEYLIYGYSHMLLSRERRANNTAAHKWYTNLILSISTSALY